MSASSHEAAVEESETMIRPVRVVAGHVVMPEQMLRDLLDRWAERNEPEHAAEQEQAEREDA